MRQFTPRQPPADIQVKPQEYKSDHELRLNHDDLYARAREYDYEQPIFDSENKKAAPPKSQKIPIQSDFSKEEMRNTPRATHECSPEIFLQTDEVSNVTDTYPHMEPYVEASLEQPEKSPTNPRSSEHNLRHNLTARTTIDISLSAELVCSTERARRRSKISRNALRDTYVTAQMFPIFYFGYSLVTNSLATQYGLLQKYGH